MIDSFDIYINSKDKIKIIDFNPICPSSSPLLFAWSELGFMNFKSNISSIFLILILIINILNR